MTIEIATSFFGARTSLDWQPDEVPGDWRSAILKIGMNGRAPLVAMLNALPSEPATNYEFNWFPMILPEQEGDVTGIYTDAALSAAYTTGAQINTLLYLKMAADTIRHFRPGHVVMMRKSDDYRYDMLAYVRTRVDNGDSSYLSVTLLQEPSQVYDLADCDYIYLTSAMNPELGTMPDSIAYDPNTMKNNTQIFINSIEASRTAMSLQTRTNRTQAQMKLDCLEQYAIMQEKALLFGVPWSGVGPNGKPMRMTGGIRYFISQGDNVFDFTTDTNFAGEKWDDMGEQWIDQWLMNLSKYGYPEMIAYCGNQVILAINRLIKARGTYEFTPTKIEYGINVTKWVTPFNTIYLKPHPLLCFSQVDSRSMLIFNLQDIKRRVILDTTYIEDGGAEGTINSKNTGYAWLDGIKEAYISEWGIEAHHLDVRGAYVNGFGLDNNLQP